MVERAGRVEGKVAIVTGAGSTPGAGIGTGKATAVVLAREGASVLLVDLHADRADETRKIIEDEGGSARVFAGDATRAGDCEAMVGAAVESFETVDILVNNIGLAWVGTVVDTTEEAWDRAFAVNLRTAFLACKHAVPVMAAKGASDEARWITGVTLPVDSGVLSVTPLMMAQHLRAVPEPSGTAGGNQ